MGSGFKRWVAFGVAFVFLAPAGWRVGELVAPESPGSGAWGLALTVAVLVLLGNVRARGSESTDRDPDLDDRS